MGVDLQRRIDAQPPLETGEIIISDILPDHAAQLFPAGEPPAIVTLPLEDAQKPSMGPLSMHLPTLDMLCVIPAAVSLSWNTRVVYWKPLSLWNRG